MESYARDARSLSTIGGQNNTPRVPNLNERLNRALDRIETEADRIERCLGRINGVPESINKGNAEVAPTRNMVSVVEHLEKQAERLRSLAENVDQIA